MKVDFTLEIGTMQSSDGLKVFAMATSNELNIKGAAMDKSAITAILEAIRWALSQRETTEKRILKEIGLLDE